MSNKNSGNASENNGNNGSCINSLGKLKNVSKLVASIAYEKSGMRKQTEKLQDIFLRNHLIWLTFVLIKCSNINSHESDLYQQQKYNHIRFRNH